MNLVPFRHLVFGDYADLFWEDTQSLSIRWEEGRVDRLVQGREVGAGLRILAGEEVRLAHIDHPDDERLTRQAQTLAQGLRPVRNLAGPAPQVQTHIPRWTKPIVEVPVEAKVALLEKAYRAAWVPQVKQISIQYGESLRHIRIFASDGRATEEERSYVTLSITVVAEKDRTLQTAYEAIAGLAGFEFFDEHDVEAIVRKVARRALAKLGAPPAPAGEMPVVIAAEAGGTLIHEAIGHSLEADSVQKGISPVYAGKIGQVVAHEKITVHDDPTQPGKRGSYAFDDEGISAQCAVLVEKGVLKTYLYDRLTAQKAGVTSNGHGRRESFRHRPIPRMANTFVRSGPDDPKQILRSVPRGLLVTQMGGGQVNTATGDFVFEVEEGFWLENGEAKHLIRGANLLGNGPDVLRSIDLVGNDLGWSVGTCGKDGQGAPVADAIPTLRIPKIVVGGIA